MSKIVVPYPPPAFDPDKWPKACWWRHAMIHANEAGHIFTITTGNCEREDCDNRRWLCEHITWVTWEWYDGLGTLIDGGMDAPTVGSVSQTYIEPIEYLDLLANDRPSESFYRITEYGDIKHPGMVVVPDLDQLSRR